MNSSKKKRRTVERMTSKELRQNHLTMSESMPPRSKTCSSSQSFSNRSSNVVSSIHQMSSRNAFHKLSSVLTCSAKPYPEWERLLYSYSLSYSALVMTHRHAQQSSYATIGNSPIRSKENSSVFQSLWKTAAPKSSMVENRSSSMWSS